MLNKINKKAQNLSIETIIIAALALLVLVVIGVLFLRGTNPIGGEIGDAEKCNIANQGQCVDFSDSCTAPYTVDTQNSKFCDNAGQTGKRCCVTSTSPLA